MPGYKKINEFILCGLKHFILHSKVMVLFDICKHWQHKRPCLVSNDEKDNHSKHKHNYITLYVYVQKQLLVSINGKKLWLNFPMLHYKVMHVNGNSSY